MKKLLIANRSEIAVRIAQTAREMGVATVAVYSEADAGAAHVLAADEAVALGGRSPGESYLDVDKLLAAVASSGADAVHPGYGFLSENSRFAAAVEAAGVTFVGPTPASIDAMGDKIRAREAAEKAGVPVIPSAAITDDGDADAGAAAELGFPVLVKAAAGGGGRGMRRVDRAEDVAEAIVQARREAGSAFGDARVYLEKFIPEPRHIEVQVFGDGRGHVLALGERECSVQRRHQKVIEEAPAPTLSDATRKAVAEAGAALARAIDYRGAGTVEFVADDEGNFYFLEMNTRLQVEHAVTEMVTSTDLVRWQIEVARGGQLPAEAPGPRGHAIECRIYAEDPAAGFLPTAGRIHRVELPKGVGVRVDTALTDAMDVPVEYDPMLAKIITWGTDRPQAIARMQGALRGLAILGIRTNQEFLLDVLASAKFASGYFKTTTIESEWKDYKGAGRDTTANLAAAAASVLVARGRGSHRTSDGPAVGSSHSAEGPWERLGAWRQGGAR
jgi:acetyl/propionyl-CoA carboxylase alpha subunit